MAVFLSGSLAAQAQVPTAPSACPAKRTAEAEALQQVATGVTYYRQQQMPQATAAFNRALVSDPCNALAHYFAWRLTALAGKPLMARQQLDFAHQLSEDSQIERTWQSVQRADAMESAPQAPRLAVLSPNPSRFFSKTLDCNGIPVRSSAGIDTDSLYLACDKILTMLKNIPPARSRLINKGAELHIIGEFQSTTDLPENAQYRDSVYIDAEGRKTNMALRTRGVGGLLSSCGEENLLHLPGDKYGDGSDTCIHEFAHDVMENGLGNQEQSEIEKQFHSALKLGLWKSSYASVNAKEYWAELSMWYFGAHGNYVNASDPSCHSPACSRHYPAGPGPEALRAYDAEGYALLVRLYRYK